MTGRPWIAYSVEELAWLKANCQLQIGDYARAFNAAFSREISPQNLNAVRKRNGWRTGRAGRFEKGGVSHNKGKPCPAGRGGNHPNARATQFKKGARGGVAVKLYQPIGTELVRDGYLVRKINDDLPLQARWRAVHLVRWEAANGPLPKGMCLKCMDGNKLNTEPFNWRLISRGELAVLNNGKRFGGLDYSAAPAELKPVILAIAKVKLARGQKRRAA